MTIRKKIKRYLSPFTDNNSKKKCAMINIPPDIFSKAKEGNATAQLYLGKIYYSATSIENNDTITFDSIRRSAEQGNIEAQFRLGDLYALGCGTAKSPADSYKWYTKAAIQGYKKAIIRIHNLYQDDIKIHCRGQINESEEECASDDFKKERNIRELNEYRLEQNKSILNGAIDYYTKQFKHYQLSDQKDPFVQLNLAFLYQHGYGTRKYIRWAFEYYLLAAEQGNTDAQYNLGRLYQQHTHKKFNYRDAFKWYTRSAHGGNMAAQRCLAYFYLKGLSTDIDYEKAVHWYTKAAEAGDSQSQVSLGLLYRKGNYIKQNISMAVKWYSLAARQGNIVAQNCLSQLHQRGLLSNIQLEKTLLEYLTEDSMNNRLCPKLLLDVSKLEGSSEFKPLNKLVKYALIGDGPAMYEIGLRYYYGSEGFPQDNYAGIKWIKHAANKEHKDAQFMMANLYKEGDTIEQDYHKSCIWYKRMAKQKDADAQCQVGVMYKKGFGVRKDPLEASKWFSWAADQENSHAQFHFGMLRLYGIGIRKDVAEAEEWLFKSVRQRNIQTCYRLGKLYSDGQFDTEKKRYLKAGLRLLEYAAEYGNTNAQLYLGDLYKKRKVGQQNLNKSFKFYTMAADSGNKDAQYKLAIIYLTGDWVNHDYTKSYNLFKKASKNGHKNASKLFQTPIEYGSKIKVHSKVLDMFIDITEKGIDNLAYNIGSIYEDKAEDNSDEQSVAINYAHAEKWYLFASKNGDSRADYRLGVIYEYEDEIENNASLAIKYYKNAIKNQNRDAMYILACMYLNKEDKFQNFQEPFRLFTKASILGCKEAIEILSVLEHDEDSTHYESPAIYRDILNRRKKLITMLKKATKRGDTQLQYQFGVMYERNGNAPKAFKWFSRAADIGITEAYYKLGIMYEEEKGVKRNYSMAARMYQKAAEKDHADSCFRLGQLYHNGYGVVQNYLKAYNFYKKADEMNHSMASNFLNIVLDTNNIVNGNVKESYFGLKSNEYQNSLKMLEYVGKQGNTEVQFTVGLAYENNYKDPNYGEVLKWYSMAAKGSHKEAIYHLGLLYEKGLGIAQDYHKAIQLYNQAYQLGSGDALHRLGTVYHHGKGVAIDPVKAIEYYTLSAKFGNPNYQSELGRLYEEGELVQKNPLETLKWYTKAYLQDHKVILSKLYNLYEDRPYEIFYFEKLYRILSIATFNHFGLNEDYKYENYCDINNQLQYMCFFGIGTIKNLNRSLQYFLKKYSDKTTIPITDFPSFRYCDFNFSQKIGILKGFIDDEECINQFNSEELHMLGMVFYDGRVQSQYFYFDKDIKTYTPINNQSFGDPSQYTVIEKDYLTAMNYLKRAADKGHPGALFQLGIMYHLGYGVQKDSDKGDIYFDLIPHDDISLIREITILYHTHNKIQNFSKAFEYYTNLEKTLPGVFSISEADRGKILGQVQYGIGLLYEYGDGVEQDYQKALGYYKNAVTNGSEIGNIRLGLMYYYGKGVTFDFQKAFDLLHEATGDDLNGDKCLYVYDQSSLTSDGEDSQRKLVYCTKTRREIYGERYYYIGLMYKHGYFFSKDEVLAQYYFREAFNIGCQRAENEIKD